jgi:glycosyltransferase involved in cell wall biosynthesis
MKVLFLFGGLPHYYNAILNRLNALDNVEVQVVIPSEKGKTLGSGVFETEKNVHFRKFRLEEYSPLGGLGKPYFKGLRQLIEEQKPNILVLSYPYSLSFAFDFSLRRYCKKHGIKTVIKEIPYQVPLYTESVSYYFNGKFVTEDLSDPPKDTLANRIRYWTLAKVRKYYYQLADAHVNYIEDAYEILGSYGVAKEKIFITYNSPDTDEILSVRARIEQQPSILPSHPRRLIHVGRLVKWKKVHLLINVVKRLKANYPDVQLVVVGSGPEEENLKKQVAGLGLEKDIIFTGGIHDTATLGRYFLCSTLYVLAGVGGLSINDAMCFGKPVLCSVADGTEKMLVTNDYNGYFFENDNETDLYQKIAYLFAHPERIAEMSKNSEKIIREKINVHTVINGYVRAFEYVMRKRQ